MVVRLFPVFFVVRVGEEPRLISGQSEPGPDDDIQSGIVKVLGGFDADKQVVQRGGKRLGSDANRW